MILTKDVRMEKIKPVFEAQTAIRIRETTGLQRIIKVKSQG